MQRARRARRGGEDLSTRLWQGTNESPLTEESERRDERSARGEERPCWPRHKLRAKATTLQASFSVGHTKASQMHVGTNGGGRS